MLDRVRGAAVVDLHDNQRAEDEPDDGLFRPWKRVATGTRPTAELMLISKTGNKRSLCYSDQKGLWHSGDTIVVKFIEEHVMYLVIRGQNLMELVSELAKHNIEWIQAIDETRAQIAERAPEMKDMNVFELSIIKRRWGEECEWDTVFDSFE